VLDDDLKHGWHAAEQYLPRDMDIGRTYAA
jgi:hypothetical protein